MRMDSWAWSHRCCHKGVCPVSLEHRGHTDRFLVGGNVGKGMLEQFHREGCWNLALVFGKDLDKEKCEKGNVKRELEAEKKG